MPGVKRPFDYRQDIADEICRDLAAGMSLSQICLNETMPLRQRVYLWLLENETFRDNYVRARDAYADVVFDDCMDIADRASNDFTIDSEGNIVVDHEAINRAKLMIDTRKWMLGKMKPKKYGEKIDVTSSDGSMTPPTVLRFVAAKAADAENE